MIWNFLSHNLEGSSPGGKFKTMPDVFYEEMDKMFEELKIQVKDTDNKQIIKNANNFIATFTPQKKPINIKSY